MKLVPVIVCTHNPRLDYLRRTIGGLKRQTLSPEQWELLLSTTHLHNAPAESMANGSCRPTKTALETIIEFGGLSSHSTYQPASMKPFCFHPSVAVIICTRDPEWILCSNRGELRRKSLESSQWDFRCQQANRAGQSSAAKFIRNNYLRLLSLDRLFLPEPTRRGEIA